MSQQQKITKKEKVGEGTYGKVYRGVNGKNNYGVKRNLIEKNLDFIASLREMDILYKFKNHPYIISIECVRSEPFDTPMSPINHDLGLKDDNVHFVFPYAESDLRVTDDIDDNYILSRYMVDILLGVEYMHSKNIIHRDLKPHNILLVEGEIKICDFGLSKQFSHQGKNSPRVVTSWYRAPELILLKEDYNFSIDVWSLGCIFFEMVAKRPFIYDVDDVNRELMKKIKKSLPHNDIDFTGDSWKKQLFGDNGANSGMENGANSGMMKIAMENYREFIDLLSHMINYYPEERYTVTQCLNHIFFREHIKHINEVRKVFPPKPDLYHKIRVINCNERLWGYDLACIVFNRRKEYKWYDHRVVFQAIDMFDRYLLHLNMIKKRQKPSDNNGYFLTKYEARLTFLVVLYMAIKYFPGMSNPISFSEIVDDKYKTKEALTKAQLIENFLINKVFRDNNDNYTIYRDTIYDIFTTRKLTGKQICMLLTIVGKMHELNQEMKLDELMNLIEDVF